MARFLPLATRWFSSTPRRLSPPPETPSQKKKGLIFRAHEVAAACGLNPFVHPAELVKPYWRRTSPNQYKEMAAWAAEIYDLPETREEMAERLAESTPSAREITQLALESTREADDTSVVHDASRRMEEQLVHVSEPSQVR